jgi:hypothetical protein
MNLPISFLLLLLSTLSSLCAQNTTSADEAVSVEFMLYSWKCTLPELRYSSEHTTEALTDPFSATKVQQYTGTPTLAFYAANARLDPTDGEAPQPLATVTFQAGATKYVIIVARSPQGSYFMYAVPKDDSKAQTPYIRLYNFTINQLAVAYDDGQVVQIAPREDRVIHPRGNATVVRVARLEGERWRRGFNNVIELNDDARRSIILAADGKRAVSMFTLPPWPKPAKANSDSPVIDELN